MRCDGFCEHLLESGLCVQEEPQLGVLGVPGTLLQSPGMPRAALHPLLTGKSSLLNPLGARITPLTSLWGLGNLHQSHWVKPLLREGVKAQHISDLLGLEDLQANLNLQFCACYIWAELGLLG